VPNWSDPSLLSRS